VISRLAWPTVQTRISTLVITQEPAGREEPVPVYSPPSYSAEINGESFLSFVYRCFDEALPIPAPVFDPNQTNFQRLAHLSSVARHSEPVLPIQLTVLTPSGKRLKIFARLSDTVLALKRKIQLLEPIEPSHQCLSFAQSLLYDGSFLGGV
jgi:hypothetical protein